MIQSFWKKNADKQALQLLTEKKVTRSNFWSYINIIGKIPSVASSAYWFGLLIDTLSGLEEDIIGLSKTGLIAGSCISFFTTASAIYCEYQINKNNSGDNDLELQHVPVRALKPYHYMILFGYLLDQAGDKASAFGLFIHIIGGDSWQRLPRALTQSGMAIFGAITSIAEIKTAKKNLKFSNQDSDLQTNQSNLNYI